MASLKEIHRTTITEMVPKERTVVTGITLTLTDKEAALIRKMVGSIAGLGSATYGDKREPMTVRQVASGIYDTLAAFADLYDVEGGFNRVMTEANPNPVFGKRLI